MQYKTNKVENNIIDNSTFEIKSTDEIVFPLILKGNDEKSSVMNI